MDGQMGEWWPAAMKVPEDKVEEGLFSTDIGRVFWNTVLKPQVQRQKETSKWTVSTWKLPHGGGKLWTNWKGNLQVGKFAVCVSDNQIN